MTRSGFMLLLKNSSRKGYTRYVSDDRAETKKNNKLL